MAAHNVNRMTGRQTETRYRWYILILSALTNALCVALPTMCMPVLFKAIAADLHLDLVQIGLVWGIGALPGIVTVLVGGMLGDRFGPKRMLTVTCLLVGLAGALRGLSTDVVTLAATVSLFGLLAPVINMNVAKTCGIWFSGKQLGLANGAISMGMALGFMLGSMISATVVAPWLGGWRQVLVLYGVLAMLLSLPWLFTRTAPRASESTAAERVDKSLYHTLSHVAGLKTIWQLGWAILCIGGCIQGMLGYLPLYLQNIGWTEANASTALASFHMVSLVFVIPIALWSDRLGSRRKILMMAAFMVLVGVSLLSMADGALVWLAVSTAGMVRDGFMAVFLTMIIETDGVGVAYAGSAVGLVMVFSGVGNLVAPPLGNSLAGFAPGLPFVFWAVLAVVGFFGLYVTKETRSQRVLVTP